ncbi:MAG: SPFH domain-containing protein [Bacteroidales bacterium]|nr:SPFH domain-containing protein [Bacteroidales bacterium]MBQ1929855.1 SPFH domain-containing protein [Bacteroidales bacterium]MBQ5784146.1 SPFH domain-containing protein [Bacteroidales bacterium]MBR6540670.1 SPFH domain-containing protein [Bacteroidales bacterium]
MKNENYVYSGWKMNGFVALFINLLLIAGSIYNFVLLGNSETFVPLFLIAALTLLVLSIIMCCGFIMLEPNEARVLLFFGNYKGTFYNTGYWWVNPFMSAKKLSLRARNLNVNPIKVNDKAGNPILIGLVLVWKIKQDGAYKAVFEIDSPDVVAGAATSRMNVLENFVAVQSDSALRQVAGMYAYDENSNNSSEEITLRSGGEEINEKLKDELNARLSMAGIEVMEARLNYLAYAPEIAAAMLRRQQADAIISAREKIVEGAVSMVKIALDRLAAEEVVELDQERKAAMVSNLLVVLCADEAAQPVVNTGTLHN